MDRDKLWESSISIIQFNQHPSGGYVASPLFCHYSYSWLRDGTFIANAMDQAGKSESAEAFYRWVHRVLAAKRCQVDALLDKHRQRVWIDRSEFLGTRYHLDGRDDHSEWGHFQLDGYGAWLWGLVEHVRLTGNRELMEACRDSVELTVDYLTTFWHYPNFDCWEEFPDFVHPSTLACVYGGLKAIGEYDGRPELLAKAEEIRRFLLTYAVKDGRFVKAIQCVNEQWQPVLEGVDASLLWLAVPFGVVEAADPLMAQTVRGIEAALKHEGIQRYEHDRYFGGGEWLLLTAWYGLVKAEQGDLEEARRCLSWICSRADALGRLPEQVPDALQTPAALAEWLERCGEPAHPLLWSHAMFLVLSRRLGQE